MATYNIEAPFGPMPGPEDREKIHRKYPWLGTGYESIFETTDNEKPATPKDDGLGCSASGAQPVKAWFGP